MCIAIAKPIGVDIPNDDILTNCFHNNPDGAGFAFNHNNEVIIRKGYMTLKDFLDAFHKYNEKFDFKNRGVLIHTRITKSIAALFIRLFSLSFLIIEAIL